VNIFNKILYLRIYYILRYNFLYYIGEHQYWILQDKCFGQQLHPPINDLVSDVLEIFMGISCYCQYLHNYRFKSIAPIFHSGHLYVSLNQLYLSSNELIHLKISAIQYIYIEDMYNSIKDRYNSFEDRYNYLKTC
jgi:hypothetical protein